MQEDSNSATNNPGSSTGTVGAANGGGSGNPKGSLVALSGGGGGGAPGGLSADNTGSDVGTSVSDGALSNEAGGIPGGLTPFSTAIGIGLKMPDTTGWYAWINAMPPKPDEFYTIGQVLLSHAMYDVALVKKYPQGFIPNTLLLELVIYEKPGEWPLKGNWKEVRYEEVLTSKSTIYQRVSIQFEEKEIVSLEVETIH